MGLALAKVGLSGLMGLNDALSGCDEASPAPSVLVLGDGDMSFSLSLLERHRVVPRREERRERRVRPRPLVSLTATTFDSAEALSARYRQFLRIRARIDELGGERVHGVDATDLPDHLRSRLFDVVVFNNPHSGSEDLMRHRQLVSHVFMSARAVLRPEAGAVVLTMLPGQFGLWEVEERARRAGLALRESGEFPWEVYPSFTHKRGHLDRSFLGERAGEQSTVYVFSRSPEPGSLGYPKEPGLCEVCGLALTEAHASLLKPEAPEFLPCPGCHGAFPNKRALDQHLATHPGEHRKEARCACRHPPASTKSPLRADCKICSGCYKCACEKSEEGFEGERGLG